MSRDHDLIVAEPGPPEFGDGMVGLRTVLKNTDHVGLRGRHSDLPSQ